MEKLEELQQMLLEANRKALENLAKSQDIKAIAREARKAASLATRRLKGYETGI